jgi:hypothetical protein
VETIEYHNKPQGKTLARYAADRSRVSIIIGALGSGKTIQTCQKIFDLMIEQEPDAEGVRKSRWCAVRNTYADLTGTTMKDWLSLYGELGKCTKGGLEPPTQKLFFKLEDGTIVKAEMIFMALDRDDAVRKIRGLQLTGAWPNEVKELNKAVIDMLDLRHGRYPENPTWHGMVGDSNAPDTDHWLYKIAEEEKPEGWKFFKQPGGLMRAGKNLSGKIKWVLNPEAENINNLPEDYYIRGMQGKTDDWIAVNLANEYGYVASGKAVFPEYSDNLHCAEFDFVEGVPIYRGWDFGVAACVLAQLTPTGRLIVRKEFVATQTTGIDSFADNVLAQCAPLKRFEFIDVGDPAGMSKSLTDEKTCFQILESKGIRIQPSIQNITARLEGVRYYLGKLIEATPAFYIHPDCKQSRKGFQGGYCYRRIQVAGERYTDMPDKNIFSHPIDCIQYIAAYIRAGYGDEIEENNDDYNSLDDGANSVTGY